MPKNIITTPEQKFSMELKKELKNVKKANKHTAVFLFFSIPCGLPQGGVHFLA